MKFKVTLHERGRAPVVLFVAAGWCGVTRHFTGTWCVQDVVPVRVCVTTGVPLQHPSQPGPVYAGTTRRLLYRSLQPLLTPCSSTTTTALHLFNGLFSRTAWVSHCQKGKTSLDLNEARDDAVQGCSGISWTICRQSAPHSRQIPFLQAGCSS